MGNIQSKSESKITVDSKEVSLLTQISADRVKNIGATVFEAAKEACQLTTWYHHNAGSLWNGKRSSDYPCEMTMKVAEGDGEVTFAFSCLKAICRGKDQCIDAALKVDAETVKQAVNMQKLIEA